MKLPNKLFLSVASLILSAFLLFPQSIVLAQDFNNNNSMQDNLRVLGIKIGLVETSPIIIIVRIIKIGLGFMGIILLILILSSGFQFMTSGGDETKVAGAKKTFFSAIIGTIIILMSYSIVSLVINTVGGATGGSAAI